MGVDLRQVVAGILTVTMFVMLGHMIKRDHFDYVEVSPYYPLQCFTHYCCIWSALSLVSLQKFHINVFAFISFCLCLEFLFHLSCFLWWVLVDLLCLKLNHDKSFGFSPFQLCLVMSISILCLLAIEFSNCKIFGQLNLMFMKISLLSDYFEFNRCGFLEIMYCLFTMNELDILFTGFFNSFSSGLLCVGEISWRRKRCLGECQDFKGGPLFPC